MASYTFAPTALQAVSAPMIKAVLPGNFVSLQNVTIVQDTPAVHTLLGDDFNITTHT